MASKITFGCLIIAASVSAAQAAPSFSAPRVTVTPRMSAPTPRPAPAPSYRPPASQPSARPATPAPQANTTGSYFPAWLWFWWLAPAASDDKREDKR